MSLTGNIGALTLDIIIRDGQATVTTKKVETGLKQVEVQAYKTNAATKTWAGGMGAGIFAVSGLTVALRGLFSLMKSSIESFVHSELVVGKLENGLNRIGASDGALDRIIKKASILESKTIFSDDAILNSYELLTTFGKSESQMDLLVKDILNVSSSYVKNGNTLDDLTQLTIAFGKVNEESVGVLQRYGIVLSEKEKQDLVMLKGLEQQQYLHEIIEKQYKNEAETVGNSLVGSYKKLGNQLDNVQEKLGGGFLAGLTALNFQNEELKDGAQDVALQFDVMQVAAEGVGAAFGFLLSYGNPIGLFLHGIQSAVNNVNKHFRGAQDELRTIGTMLSAAPPTNFFGQLINLAGDAMLWVANLKNDILDVMDLSNDVASEISNVPELPEIKAKTANRSTEKKNTGSRGSKSPKQEDDPFEKQLAAIELGIRQYKAFNGLQGMSTKKAIEELEKIRGIANTLDKQVKLQERINELKREGFELMVEISRESAETLQNWKDLGERVKQINDEIAQKRIDAVSNEFERRKQQTLENYRLEIDRVNALSDLEANADRKRELKELAYQQMERELSQIRKDSYDANDKIQQQRIENIKNFFSASLSLASQLVNILGIGAHTFVYQLINGLQQGLSLAASIAQVIASLNSVKAAGGFLGGIFSLLAAPFTGGASLVGLGGGGGFAAGGLLPGVAGGPGDNMLISARSGEFVMQESAVKKFGVSFFNSLNRGVIPGYARGGFVGKSPVVNTHNHFTVQLDRRGNVSVMKEAMRQLNSDNSYYGCG